MFRPNVPPVVCSGELSRQSAEALNVRMLREVGLAQQWPIYVPSVRDLEADLSGLEAMIRLAVNG